MDTKNSFTYHESFPDNFLWGGATAANQLEGGKGMSVADVYTFDSSMPRSEWHKQWLEMSQEQVDEAMDPSSKKSVSTIVVILQHQLDQRERMRSFFNNLC